jgi:endo-1,4-beta-mannosidase
MAKRDMKAVLYLNNFWQWSGGMSQYMAWINGKPVMDPDVTGDWNAFMDNSASFYREPKAQQAFHQGDRQAHRPQQLGEWRAVHRRPDHHGVAARQRTAPGQ